MALSVDSKVKELMKNEAAADLLEKYAPGFKTNPQMKLVGALTFRKLASFPQAGLDAAKVEEIDAALKALESDCPRGKTKRAPAGNACGGPPVNSDSRPAVPPWISMAFSRICRRSRSSGSWRSEPSSRLIRPIRSSRVLRLRYRAAAVLVIDIFRSR